MLLASAEAAPYDVFINGFVFSEDGLPIEDGNPTFQYMLEFSTILTNMDDATDFIEITSGKARLAFVKG
jgi:hypothetical protein